MVSSLPVRLLRRSRPARPSLLTVLHRSARGDVRKKSPSPGEGDFSAEMGWPVGCGDE